MLTQISAGSIQDGPSEEVTKVNYSMSFVLEVPEDHLVRKIDTALDLSWLRSELAPHYLSMGRPSIAPELMIRMLVVGYVFAIRSERLICREVQVNLAYRWFCKLRAKSDRFESGGIPNGGEF